MMIEVWRNQKKNCEKFLEEAVSHENLKNSHIRYRLLGTGSASVENFGSFFSIESMSPTPHSSISMRVEKLFQNLKNCLESSILIGLKVPSVELNFHVIWCH